jgi:hypothetical protein
VFEVESLDRKGRVKLEDYRGKNVLLHFWATWCRPRKVSRSCRLGWLLLWRNDRPAERKIMGNQSLSLLLRYIRQLAQAPGDSPTCRELGIEPWRYLRDVLERLPSHSPERLAELLPDEWAQSQCGAIGAAPQGTIDEVAIPYSG